MSDRIRAALQRLTELEGHTLVDCTADWAEAMIEARAALAESVGEGPTDEELKAAYWKAYRQNTIRDSEECFLAALRAIYRWDRPALAEPVGEGPTEEELLQVAAEAGGLASIPLDSPFGDEFMPDELIAFARAVLARWGHQPAPPAAGEVGEIADGLRDRAAQLRASGFSVTAGEIERAADLLEQRHPAPVPVAERLPGPEDCDEEGRCWWFCFECPGEHSYWILAKEVYCDPTHWRPFTALPLPSGEVQP